VVLGGGQFLMNQVPLYGMSPTRQLTPTPSTLHFFFPGILNSGDSEFWTAGIPNFEGFWILRDFEAGILNSRYSEQLGL